MFLVVVAVAVLVFSLSCCFSMVFFHGLNSEMPFYRRYVCLLCLGCSMVVRPPSLMTVTCLDDVFAKGDLKC